MTTPAAPATNQLLETDSLAILGEALERLQASFADLPAYLPSPGAADVAPMRAVLAQVADRMADNYPYFHPLYAGQMLKPPHPIARAAYTLATWINPNNHARDGGRASSAMEIEAVDELAHMLGWDTHLGHLTSGGTFANLEALWVAGQLSPGKKVVASEQAHYTHSRISAVLGLQFETVPVDSLGRMDLRALEARLAEGETATVVATLGTTATGAVDPLAEIAELRSRYNFRIHADAAYGGYFTLAGNLSAPARAAYDALGQADSVVVDPHKHGLQPYGCGSILFRDPTVGRFYKHDSPYTYFTSEELHLGEISLECSRAGAAAVALWATQQLLPLEPGGEFAGMLDSCRAAALDLQGRLGKDQRFVTAAPPQLDIVVWAVRAGSTAESSRRARLVFSKAAELDLHLALVELPISFFPENSWPAPASAGDRVLCLRSVLMKPEHRQWMEEIWQRLSSATEAVQGNAQPRPQTQFTNTGSVTPK